MKIPLDKKSSKPVLKRKIRNELMISHMTKPDFLIIGTQRGGTTSLFSLLSAHPGIFMPEEKEVHYFDLNYEKGIDWYTAKFPAHPRETKVISGEASPYYLYHPHVPARVAKDLPEVKLIALLRDPVNRHIRIICSNEKGTPNHWILFPRLSPWKT